jgi:hypothetical protein
MEKIAKPYKVVYKPWMLKVNIKHLNVKYTKETLCPNLTKLSDLKTHICLNDMRGISPPHSYPSNNQVTLTNNIFF